MMHTKDLFIGIDISKRTLDIATCPGKTCHHVSNDPQGIRRAVRIIQAQRPTLVVMEASGGLEMPLAAGLEAAALPVVVANLTRVRAFARSAGKLAKTDRLDAQMIAHYARAIRPPVRPLCTPEQAQLKALVTRRRQVVHTLTAEKNRLSSAPEVLRASIQRHLDWHWINCRPKNSNSVTRIPSGRPGKLCCAVCPASAR